MHARAQELAPDDARAWNTRVAGLMCLAPGLLCPLPEPLPMADTSWLVVSMGSRSRICGAVNPALTPGRSLCGAALQQREGPAASTSAILCAM
jgi:hypothetical protein